MVTFEFTRKIIFICNFFTRADQTSLSLTTLARNSPLSLAIAMTAFPGQPFIALTLVIGPLLELPILAVITQILLATSKRSDMDKE